MYADYVMVSITERQDVENDEYIIFILCNFGGPITSSFGEL